MRPTVLDPLFSPVTTVSGVGPKVAGLLQTLLLPGSGAAAVRVRDLLFHLPSGLVDRRRREEIATAPDGVIVTLTVRIDRHLAPSRAASSQPYRVFASDETGEVALTYFRAQTPWMEKLLPVGETMLVSGRVEWFNGRPSMIHPDFVAPLAEAGAMPLVEPVYPLTAGLSAKVLRRTVAAAVAAVPAIDEWIDPSVIERHAFPPFRDALQRLHDPQDAGDIDPMSPSFRRLAYDEFLAGQAGPGARPPRHEAPARTRPRRRREPHAPYPRRVALHADRGAGGRPRRHSRRHGRRGAYAAAPPGRCRLGQDDRGAFW